MIRNAFAFVNHDCCVILSVRVGWADWDPKNGSWPKKFAKLLSRAFPTKYSMSEVY